MPSTSTRRAPAPVETDDELRLSPFRIGVLIIVVATVLFRAWTLSSWSWFQDDWLYITEVQRLGFWEYVFQGYNSHLMPGQFLLVWVSTTLSPLDYGWAVAITCFFSVTVLLAWAAALRALFGERAHLLIALVLLAMNPIFTSTSLWWAAALQILPLQTFMGLAVYFLARYLLHGRRTRDVVGLTLSYALGLFFWQKAVLIMVPLVFLCLMLGRGTVRDRLRAAVPLLWPAAALTMLYLPVYVLSARGGVVSPTVESFEPRGLGQAIDFYLHGILDVGLPSLVGGPFTPMSSPWSSFPAASGVQTLALIALALLLGTSALVFRRRSGLAIAMTATYALLSWGLVLLSTRYDVFGIEAARTGRYAADIVPVALLTCMFLATPTADGGTEASLRRPLSRAHRDRIKQALTVLLVGVSASSIVTTGQTWDLTAPASPKPWVDTVTADAQRLGRADVYDTPAPTTVLHPIWFYGRARLSDILGPLDLPMTYDQPTTQFVMADSSGHLREAEILEPAAANPTPSPVPNCGYLVEPGRTTRIPLTLELYDFAWVVQLDYFGETESSVTVETDTASVDLALTKGLSRVQYVSVDSIRHLDVRGTAGSEPVCITQVKIGLLAPTERPARPVAATD